MTTLPAPTSEPLPIVTPSKITTLHPGSRRLPRTMSPRLISGWSDDQFARRKAMIVGKESAIRTDMNIGSDSNRAFVCNELTAGVYGTTRADYDTVPPCPVCTVISQCNRTRSPISMPPPSLIFDDLDVIADEDIGSQPEFRMIDCGTRGDVTVTG